MYSIDAVAPYKVYYASSSRFQIECKLMNDDGRRRRKRNSLFCVCVKICKINQVRIVISVAFRDIIAFCQDISHHSGGVGFASIAMHSFD